MTFHFAHHVLLRGSPLIEGWQDEHDLVVGNSKVVQDWTFALYIKHFILKHFQGQERLDQEEEIRITEDRSDGSVQRAC